MGKHLCCFIVCLVLSKVPVTAQAGRWTFGLSYGSAAGVARIQNHFDFQATDMAFLHIRPQLSQKWYTYKESGLKDFERFLYGSFIALEAELPVGVRYAFQTGLETGGRSFVITEYPSQNARYPGEPHIQNFANRARQNILVSSLPIRFIRLSQSSSILRLEPIAGMSLSYAYAPSYQSYFYKTNGVSRFFPTLDLGLRIREQKWNRFSFNMVYQQGFSTINEGQLELLSSRYVKQPAPYFPVTYKGSSFRLSLSYHFIIRTRKKAVGHLERKKSHELQWDCSGVSEICVFDDALEDGDSVAVYIGDNLLAPGMALTKDGFCFPVNCESTNQVVTIVPLNEGRIMPNTVRVQLKKDGVVLTDEILKSGKDRKIVILLKPETP